MIFCKWQIIYRIINLQEIIMPTSFAILLPFYVELNFIVVAF